MLRFNLEISNMSAAFMFTELNLLTGRLYIIFAKLPLAAGRAKSLGAGRAIVLRIIKDCSSCYS